MDNLRRLLASDLSKATDEELFAGMRDALLGLAKGREWVGRLVAEARRRDIPWSRLEGETGKRKATLDRWVGEAP